MDRLKEIMTQGGMCYSKGFKTCGPFCASYKNRCGKMFAAILAEFVERGEVITGETSDGYHTFNELYEFRLLYNAALFNEFSAQGKYQVHKSKKHSDGLPCFDGTYFIVMAQLPAGQISNHYKLCYWDLFKCEEREQADKWDGHTAQDVAKRLSALSKGEEVGK